MAVCSDLIHQQTTVLNYCDLILADLESYTTTQSIWKRTPTAISYEALETSLLEAEDFAKKLFWGVPVHLGPIKIFRILKEFSIFDFLIALIFIILSATAFIFIKRWLFKVSAKFEYKSQHKTEQTKRITYTIFSALLNFILEHYNLLFTLISIYLYINLEYQDMHTPISLSPILHRTVLFNLHPIFSLYINTVTQNIKRFKQKIELCLFCRTNSRKIFSANQHIHVCLFNYSSIQKCIFDLQRYNNGPG